MHSELYSHYLKYRAKGYPPGVALDYVRHEDADDNWLERAEELKNRSHVEWDEGPLHYVATLQFDDDPDFSFYGRYSNKWCPGAIDRCQGNAQAARRSRQLRYFIPNYELADNWKALRRVHGRHEAYEIARQAWLGCYKRMEKLGDTWNFVGVVVNAYVGTQQVASGSLWGNESDSDAEYFADTLESVATELLDEAKESAKRLYEDAIRILVVLQDESRSTTA